MAPARKKRRIETNSDNEEIVPSTFNGDDDASSSDEEERELDHSKSQRQKQTNGKASKATPKQSPVSSKTAGTILSVMLDNFMCHKKLIVDFGPCITIITGQNGSGKSSILLGIQIALGAKTSATQRGNLKDLIKAGEETALVTLTLCNEGVDAYKPEKYGTCIIIEKRIDKKSGSNLKIKNDEGKTVSTKQKELKEILMQCSIFPDNPCTILTQEVSKKLLGNSTPNSKYMFFLSASLLQHIQENIIATKENFTKMTALIKEKRTVMKDNEKELKRLHEEYQSAKSLQDIENQIQQLHEHYFWAIVEEKENEIQALNTKVEVEDKKLKAAQETQRVQDENIKKYEEQRKKYEEESTSISNKINGVTDNLDMVTRQITHYQKQASLRKNERKDVERKISIAEQHINTHRRKIADVKRQQEEKQKAYAKKLQALKNADKDAAARLEAITKFETEASEHQVAIEQLNKEYDDASNLPRELNNKLRITQEEHQRCMKLREGYAREASKLASQQQDILKYFGESTSIYLNAIAKNSSKFSLPPIGPIGLFVHCGQAKWTAHAEYALAKSMRAYVVNTKKDKELLDSLAQQCKVFPLPVIIIQKFADVRYDTSAKRLKGVLNLEDVVVVRDAQYIAQHTPVQYPNRKQLEATLWNVLIDQHDIESIVLIEDRKEADQNMFSTWSKEQLRMVTQCFTLTPTCILSWAGSSRVTQKLSLQSKLWQANYANQIADVNAKRKEAEEKIKAVESTRATQYDEKTRAEKETKEIQTKLVQKRSKLKELEKNLENLKMLEAKRKKDQDIQPEEDDSEAIIETYNDTIREKQVEIDALKEELAKKASSETDESEQQLQLEKNKINDLSKQHDELKRQANKNNVALDDLADKITHSTAGKHQIDNDVKKYEQTILLFQKKIDAQTALLETSKKHAIDIQPTRPVKVGKSPAECQEQRNKLNSKKRAEAARFGNRNFSEIKRVYVEYKQNLEETNKLIASASTNTDLLGKSVDERFQKWLLIRDVCTESVAEAFSRFLSQKGHNGKVTIDHDALAMDTSVTLSKHAVTDAKSLSGGERSFTTTCLLMSIWKVVEPPFRFLDEFDVFMDALYRKIALQSIVKEAQTTPTRQTILLTPQDVEMPADTNKDLVKMIRLRPPRENNNMQQTLIDEFV